MELLKIGRKFYSYGRIAEMEVSIIMSKSRQITLEPTESLKNMTAKTIKTLYSITQK